MRVREAIETVNQNTQVYSVVKREGGLLSLNGSNMTDELLDKPVFKVEVNNGQRRGWRKDIVVIRVC